MYGTIDKTNKNFEKDTANMIIAEFTGQIKGWWDNRLSESQRMSILNVIKDENRIIPKYSLHFGYNHYRIFFLKMVR